MNTQIRWVLAATLGASVLCGTPVASAAPLTDLEPPSADWLPQWSEERLGDHPELWAQSRSCNERSELLWAVAEAAELDGDEVYEDSFAACMAE